MRSDTKTEILELLCQKVRVMSAEQIAREFFGDSEHSKTKALNLVRGLETQGYVTTKRVSVRQIESAGAPLFAWEPGQSDLPNFRAIAAANRRRWNGELHPTTVVFPTEKANRRFGSGKLRVVRRQELEHDLLAANVYFSLALEEKRNWANEDALEKSAFGNRRPDAVLFRGGVSVIEVAGRSYSAEKLEAIFTHFKAYSLRFH
ncbi:MAG: hypothetical protein AAFX06_32885 [Planctomycetota bacterium]